MGTLSKTLSYGYDKQGKRTELTHADGQKFSYVRDVLGRVSNLYEGASQVSTAQLIQNSFDDRGLIDTMQRGTAGSAFVADFSFDSVGRLSSFANDAAAGTANDLTISQTFNPASQIVSQTRSNDSYSWTGSAVVNRNYTTNGLNQYTAAGPASFTYDANGNLTSDGSSTFVYDIENRLVSASGSRTASLAYDPMGRLFQVTGTGTDTRFLYDGDELIAEYDAAGTMARRYVRSDNVDDPVVEYAGASVGSAARIFLMPDERGSIAGRFASDGSSIAKNSYDEYGIPGAANAGRFQYTGQAWLPELGMYHYKARIYSPTLGRFLQVDPIGHEDQYNLYAYVGNDPINAADPDGQKVGAAIGVGARICLTNSPCRSAIMSGIRLFVRAAVAAIAGERRKEGPYLYRGLSMRDVKSLEETGAILPMDPSARNTAEAQVMGKPTQFVSLSRDYAVAEKFTSEYQGDGAGLVATVDQSKLPGIIDTGKGEQLTTERAKSYARNDREVLTGFIPGNAIVRIDKTAKAGKDQFEDRNGAMCRGTRLSGNSNSIC